MTNIPYEPAALAFAEALGRRDYPAAYALTSSDYRARTTVDRMRADFETMIPPDWGPIGPIEVGLTMEEWPEKEPSDLGWAYVSIGGEVYSEAVTVVVTLEGGEPRIRSVEWGRP